MYRLVFFLFLFFNYNLFSQGAQEWTARYNGIGNGYDAANSIITDNLGNIVLTGHSQRVFGTSNSDYATIKYFPTGELQWVSIYNGPGNDDDYPEKVVIDKNNDIYVSGWSKGIGNNYDYATIKYNTLGIEQWVARYNGISNDKDQARSLVVDDSGNVFVTGQSYNSTSLYDCITIKYSSTGIQKWLSNYNNLNNSDGGYDIKLDNFGNIYVVGYSANVGSQEDFITIKYNSSGIQQWIARYDGIAHQTDEAKYLSIDDSGNIYVCGASLGVGNYEDYVVVKYNSFGIEKWVKRYDGSAIYFDKPCGVQVGKTGNIYVSGFSTESGTGYDFTTIKYNSIGNLLWIAKYNNGLNDIAFSFVVDSKENVYVTGESDGNSFGFDYATVKFDSAGNQKWVKRYSSQGDSNDRATSLTLDTMCNVYVTGYSGTDFLTIKYHQTITTINPVLSEVPSDFNLEQNFPNPFNPVTSFKYQVSQLNNVKLFISDILGNEIAVLVNENKIPGSYEIQWNAENFSSGIYFYSLQVDGNLIDTKKMLLLK